MLDSFWLSPKWGKQEWDGCVLGMVGNGVGNSVGQTVVSCLILMGIVSALQGRPGPFVNVLGELLIEETVSALYPPYTLPA